MMNNASTPTQPPLHPIAKFLEQKQVRTVVVIDDAFDDQRSVDELISGEPAAFWERIEFDADARAFLDGQGLQLEDEFGLHDDDVMQRLWELRHEPGSLGVALREVLFAAMIEKQTFLSNFVNRLRERLGLTVYTEGRNVDVKTLFQDKEVQFVFLDYLLGPENQKESITSSKNIAREIYHDHKGRRMPLVILMSTATEVYERGEEFRRSSDLLMGMFYVVHKDELATDARTFLNLGIWSKALPLGADLQAFVNTLERSTRSASQRFINGIKKLSLEDYRYIQRLSLLEDGQPLGDYLIGLYSAYLGHLLFERDAPLRAQRKVVDEMTSSYPPPGSVLPSTQLAKIYHAALFELEGTAGAGYDMSDEGEEDDLQNNADEDLAGTSGEVGFTARGDAVLNDARHNATTATEDPGGENSPGDDILQLYEQMYRHSGMSFPQVDDEANKRILRLGDLFVRVGRRQALLIINADCDLAHECEIDDSIYLLPGKLQPLKERIDEADKTKNRTELFALDGQAYRIIWDIRKTIGLTFAQINDFLSRYEYVWKARLRQPYALELQRAFAANLTRIGMPVAPPIIQPITIELLGRVDDEKWINIMAASDDLAVVVMKPDAVTCYPTGLFSQKLRDAVVALLEKQQDHQTALAAQGAAEKDLTKAKKNFELLEKFNQNFEVWFWQIEELAVPTQPRKITKLPNTLAVGISWNLTSDVKPESKAPQLVVNITGLVEEPLKGLPEAASVAATNTTAGSESFRVEVTRDAEPQEIDYPHLGSADDE